MESAPSLATSRRSILQAVCVVGAGVVGLVLLSYAVYFVPNQLGSSVADLMGLLVVMAILGALSVSAAVGYSTRRIWGWYAQVVSTFGQLLLPGGMFEFKFDLYHILMWIAPLASLVMVVLVGINLRRTRRIF